MKHQPNIKDEQVGLSSNELPQMYLSSVNDQQSQKVLSVDIPLNLQIKSKGISETTNSLANELNIISIRQQIIQNPLEGVKALSNFLATFPEEADKRIAVDLKRAELEDIERSMRLFGPEVDKKATKNRIIFFLLELCLALEQRDI